MSARLYMDVHVPLPITVGLRLREVEVITAQEDSIPNCSIGLANSGRRCSRATKIC